MSLFQYIGMPEANFSFDANPDETVYEPVDVTPPVSSKKATSATSEESK